MGSVRLYAIWNGKHNPLMISYHDIMRESWEHHLRFDSFEGFVFLTPKEGTIPLYHGYKESIGDHLYVTEREELGRLGYSDKGILAYVFPA
jgi:hypothetical protein